MYADGYLKRFISEWLAKHGWEPPFDPNYSNLPWRIDPQPNPWRAGPDPVPWRAGPDPDPWRVAAWTVQRLVNAAVAKTVLANQGARIVEGEKFALGSSATQTIDAILDDTCGTPSRHWPWPGPPPWAWEIASQLTIAANELQPGLLRDELTEIAGKAISRSR